MKMYRKGVRLEDKEVFLIDDNTEIHQLKETDPQNFNDIKVFKGEEPHMIIAIGQNENLLAEYMAMLMHGINLAFGRYK